MSTKPSQERDFGIQQSASTSPDSLLPTRFTLFPDFPAEIQYIVWEHASNVVLPRVVHIIARKDDDNKTTYGTPTPCPVLMHTCQTSREIMLKKWTFLCHDPTDSKNKKSGTIPVNRHIDSIYLPRLKDRDDYDALLAFTRKTRIRKSGGMHRIVINISYQFKLSRKLLRRIYQSGHFHNIDMCVEPNPGRDSSRTITDQDAEKMDDRTSPLPRRQLLKFHGMLISGGESAVPTSWEKLNGVLVGLVRTPPVYDEELNVLVEDTVELRQLRWFRNYVEVMERMQKNGLLEVRRELPAPNIRGVLPSSEFVGVDVDCWGYKI